MARWDDARGVWRITAAGSRPGEKRHRVVRSVSEPHTRVGRRAAEAAEIKLRAEILEALELELPGGQTPDSFALAAAAWVDRHPKWSPKTIKEVRYALRRYILPTLGSIPLDQVTPTQIEGLYAKWTREGFAASAMRRWHGIIRAIFKDAERLGQLRIDPMRRVEPAGGSAPERMHIPEPADVRRAIAAASPSAALFFELAAGTGARRGTLIALRWGDLDLEGGTVTFRHAISEGDDGPVLKGTKANRPYAVHLTQPALEGLKAHHVRVLETALAMGVVAGKPTDLFVFSRDGGRTHWNVQYPSHAWRWACAKAGVTGCRLHDLRHFHATHLLARGVPYRVVAERLGCTESNKEIMSSAVKCIPIVVNHYRV
jgi:integrase